MIMDMLNETDPSEAVALVDAIAYEPVRELSPAELGRVTGGMETLEIIAI